MMMKASTLHLLFLLLANAAVSPVASIRQQLPRFAIGISAAKAAAEHPHQSCSAGRRRSSFLVNTDSNEKHGSNLLSTATRGGAKTRGGASSVAAVKTMSAGRMKVFNLFSGGIAGTIASCITNPLEVVKTQLQSSSTSSAAHGSLASAGGRPVEIAQGILRTDGLAGFFRGLKPTLIGIIPARSAYFYAYESCKRGLGPYLPEGSVGNALLSGLAAGVAGNTLTNPIWLVKTRMQLIADGTVGQKVYSGYGDVISSIYREEGLGGFYKGISASYWGCAEGAVQFVLYEKVKARLLDRQNEHRAELGLPATDKLPKIVYFGSAAFAKGIAAIATYPHEVARTRLREQARDGIFKYHGMWQTIGLVGKEEGRRGLYAGMGVHLAKVVPNSAIMFLTYEVVNSWLSQFTVTER